MVPLSFAWMCASLYNLLLLQFLKTDGKYMENETLFLSREVKLYPSH